ncbi:MAG: diguanylate cyclase [Pyrinomonadaceae bacterium]|nr:diguanylate cyclase [Pyrinomonadaceae bacterium]
MTIKTVTNSNEGIGRIKWVLFLAAMPLLGLAAIEIFQFTVSTVVTLVGSLVVALILGKYRVTVPGTKVEFLPKIVIGFWGAMWLGVPGGILLGMVASIVERSHNKKSVRSTAALVAGDVVAAAVSSLVYAAGIRYFTNASQTAVGGILVPNEVIIASALMGCSYFMVSTAIGMAHETPGLRESAFAGSLSRFLQSCLLSVFTAIVLFLAFDHFGIEFGIVLIPLAIFGNLAFKIHTRSLEHKTRQITEASRIHLATVEALATAIDARDQVGMGHVRRTQIYAVGIATAIGLGEDEINAIRMGALLHDIGKLAIPDHILNKPGRLTPAELEKTKIHSEVGASILETVGFPYPVVPTVKYHHECWDGSGYPVGLMGIQIPITARILTVADIFDTLREARPYRAAVARDSAIKFILDRSGTQFDPKLVEVLLKNLRKFEEEIEAAGLSYNQEVQVRGGERSEESAAPHFVEQIKRANHEVFMLYSLAKEFSGSLNLDETLSLFTKKIAEFVPYDACIVYLLDHSGATATAALTRGLHAEALAGRQVSVGEGATGYALEKMKSIGNVDPVLDFAFSNTEIGQDFTSMMCVPLMADDKLIGAISLYSAHLSNYSEDHIRLVDTVSRIAADAAEKALKHAEAQAYALTDPLTGLPNSRSLQAEFDKEVVRASRSGSTFQLLVLDLDGFKPVNDTFGHKVGDRLLKEISRVIREQMREYDFLARYGGDEFVALVPETDPADVKRLQRRIEEAVSNFSLQVGDSGFAKVGVSVGSASYPSQGLQFDELIVAADKAMYLTKAINRQRSKNLGEEIHRSADHTVTSRPDSKAAVPAEEHEPDLLLFADEEGLVGVETPVIRSTAIN